MGFTQDKVQDCYIYRIMKIDFIIHVFHYIFLLYIMCNFISNRSLVVEMNENCAALISFNIMIRTYIIVLNCLEDSLPICPSVWILYVSANIYIYIYIEASNSWNHCQRSGIIFRSPAER